MNVNRLTIIVGSLVMIVVVALGWTLGISPKLDEAAATSAQQQIVVNQNLAQEAELVKLREQFTKIDVLRADYGALQTAIPRSVNGVDFIDQLVAGAAAADVKLTTVTVGEPEEYIALGAPAGSAAPAASAAPGATAPASTTPAATTPAATTGSSPAALAGKLYTVAVTISATGPSENFYNFVDTMQGGSRLLMVNSSTFSALGSTPSGSISGFVLVVIDSTPVAAAPAG